MAEMYKNKPVHLSYPFQDPVIFINDPATIEHVLKTRFPIYVKGSHFHSRCADVVGDGMLGADGEKWRAQRKTAVNVFNVKYFEEFVGGVFENVMQSLKHKLDSYAASETVFDLQELFYRFTMDSFCKIAFDYDLQSMDKDAQDPFAIAFEQAQNHMKYRFVNPLWRLEELFTSKGAKQKANCKIVRDFALEVVRKRRAELLENGNTEDVGHDMLACLMKVKDENGNDPSDEVLAEYSLSMIVAGTSFKLV
jgi:cytochrome P450